MIHAKFETDLIQIVFIIHGELIDNLWNYMNKKQDIKTVTWEIGTININDAEESKQVIEHHLRAMNIFKKDGKVKSYSANL